MPKMVHFVVMVDELGRVFFDADGSREWIRTLFEPPTNTYDLEEEEFVPVAPEFEDSALEALKNAGVIFEGGDELWRLR